MMKNLIVMGMILSFITVKSQGNGEIKGIIMDKETGETLIGANVWIEYGGEKRGSAADLNGKYTVKPIPAGTYTIHFSFQGKAEVKKTNVIIKTDQVKFIDTVWLSDTAIMGKEVVIEATKTDLINPNEASLHVLEEKQLDKIAGVRNPRQLATIASNGAITSSGDGSEIVFRGSRSGTMITFLDGIKIRGSVPTVPQAALKSYRVYTGGVPAKYGDTMGGVIEIETKNFFDLYNQRIAQMGITYNKKKE